MVEPGALTRNRALGPALLTALLTALSTVLLTLLAVAWHAGSPTISRGGGASPPPAPVDSRRLANSPLRPVELPSTQLAHEWLARLRPVERRTPQAAGYRRGFFGDSWLDTDRNGCNQRDDVLLRDGVPGTVWVVEAGRCDHDVVAGTWLDPYSGRVITSSDLKNLRESQRVQIDHVVPLAEAWVSGAEVWSDKRRRRFANDLSELQATDGPTNASKGDGDPAAWRPKKDHQCAYAKRWIAVKSTYGLGVDASERRALAELLAYCD